MVYDFSKVFDAICQSTLLIKLNHCGVHDPVRYHLLIPTYLVEHNTRIGYREMFSNSGTREEGTG